MKLTAAKFALLVFVLLALGMFVAAAPQSDDGGLSLDSPFGGGNSDDSSTTPSTDESGDDTSTGGSKTGSGDTNTDDDSSTTARGGNSDDEEPSTSPSRPSSGSRNTPESDDDDTDDATSKSPKSGGRAKNNDDDEDDNSSRNNNSNGSRSGKNSNGKNRNNHNNANDDRPGNAKNAKNTDTSESANQDGPKGTDPASSPSTEVSEEEAKPKDLKKANMTCSSDDECESGSCEDGKCAEKEDDDKIGKTLGMALGIIVAVMCIGMVLLTGVRMMMKRRRSDYYAKRISEIATPSRATTPSFYHDSSSLVLEKQARNGNYSFKSPEAAVSSDSVRPPAQGYVYGAADGYDMDQSYTRTGVPNYTNDQHLYAPNASANDWAITPTYGAFPTTPASDPNPIPVPQPTMLPAPAMSPIPPRNVQPAADPHSKGSNALSDLLARELTGGAGDRDSELIMYGGAASQNLTRESVYDASGDQSDGGRYKMNSIYSAYGRDSLYADTKDTPSVPNVPDLPSQYQKRDNY